jgi:hypothetical protein
MHPRGANAFAGSDGTFAKRNDLRFWRSAAHGDRSSRLRNLRKLAFLPIISAAVLFTAQSFVTRVQYFNVVSGTHPASMPIATTIEKFVRSTLGFAPAAPPTVYDAEMQMSSAALLNRWNPLIEMASRRFGVPQAWIRSVMRMESGGRTMSSATMPITSHAGAMGLMQVMPGTYQEMRAQYRLGANAYDPHDNVFAAAAYLRWLSARYGFPAMFAAYNDGPGHFEDRMAHGETLPTETRTYVSRIAATLGVATDFAGGALHGREVTLTRPNGDTVAVEASAVASVRAAMPGEYAPGVNAVLTVGRERQGVRETVAAVEAALHGRGDDTRIVKGSALHHLRLAQFAHIKRISVSYSLRG